MSLMQNYNPEDNVPTRADIVDMLKQINKNVKPQKDNLSNARARNKQRRDAIIPDLKSRNLTDEQIKKVLSDLPSYAEFESEGEPHVLREM